MFADSDAGGRRPRLLLPQRPGCRAGDPRPGLQRELPRGRGPKLRGSVRLGGPAGPAGPYGDL